jgi:hypothetical protein
MVVCGLTWVPRTLLNYSMYYGSIVHHLQSATLRRIDDDLKDDYKRIQGIKFNRKFNENIFNLKHGKTNYRNFLSV